MIHNPTVTLLDRFLHKKGNKVLGNPGKPVVMGTGLVALDVVLTDRPDSDTRLWAGGTCGNVLAILSFLGWQAYPLATLGDDSAAETVIDDLQRFEVLTQFIKKSSERHTPIVVEEIKTRGDMPQHRFARKCPNCGAWLPGYRALLADEARALVESVPAPNVFLFDRLSRGALELAKSSARQGAVVVFEPSGIRDNRLFQEAVATCHILKYSNERLGHLRELTYPSPLLEIETMGREGLRYRTRLGGRMSSSTWKTLDAYTVEDFRDAAGAGDWCTAGVLHALGTNGARKFMQATQEEIEAGLSLGQALAAINCSYEGARGLMYDFHPKQLEEALVSLRDSNGKSSVRRFNKNDSDGMFSGIICPECK